MIFGAAQDFKLLLDFLPAYLPQFKKFHNIMMGVSLGGHTAWRMPLLAPGQLEAMSIVVGCPTLTSLLLERLGVDASSLGVGAEDLHTIEYDDLEKVMTLQQRRRWPRALANLVRDTDRKVEKGVPLDMPILMCNGEYDKLVPARYTKTWLNRREASLPEDHSKRSSRTNLFVQENTGHSCTKEMVAMVAEWLGNMYQS